MQAVIFAATWAWNAIGGWAGIGKWLLTAAATTAASYGLGRLLAKKPQTGGLTTGSPLDLQIDAAAPRRVIYGEKEVGGVLRFRHSQGGTNNDYLYLILIWAGHPCEAITSFKVDGAAVSFDSDGNAIGNLSGFLRVTHHLGAHDQAADSNFVSELGALWTSDFRWRGCCYSAIRLKSSQDKWPTGVPQLTAVVKGRKVYDWRDDDQDIADPSTWLWSPNPALCIADTIRGVPMLNGDGDLIRPFGIGAPDTSVIVPKLIASANACDEDVPLAGGGSEKRYTCNGCYDTNAAPPDILDALGGAMAGKIVQIGADFHIYAGVWMEPDFTVDDSMLRDEPTASNPLPRQERINVVKGTYGNPAASGQPDDFMPIVSDAFIEEDGGELVKDLSLNFTNSDTMAQRIAKIALLRSRQGIVTDWPCNLKAVPALTGENVNVTSNEFGWAAKAFELQEFTLDLQTGDDGGLGFTTELVMQETDPSIFDWDTDEEQTRDPAPNTNIPDPRSVPTPSGLTLLSDDTTAFYQNDGTWVPRLKVSIDQAMEAFVLNGGFVEFEYKKHIDSDWRLWIRTGGDATTEFISDVVSGALFDARARFVNRWGVPGPYASDTSGYTIAGKAEQPPDPTGGALTQDGVLPKFIPGTQIFNFGTRAYWDNPTNADYAVTEIKATNTDSDAAIDYTWRGFGSNEFTSEKTYTLYSGFLFPGYVRIRHFNTSGVPSNWVRIGNANSSPTIGTGNLAAQDADSAKTTGLAMGVGSSVQSVQTRFPLNNTFTLTGGAPSEQLDIDISNRGFTAKPDGPSQKWVASNDKNIVLYYDWDDVGSTSTNLRLNVYTEDGANIPSAAVVRLAAEFWENA